MGQVLIVADGTVRSRGLARKLQGAGADVVVAPHPRIAGPLLSRHQPLVCVIDVRSPDERRRAVQEVTRRSPGTAVVALVDDQGEDLRLEGESDSVLLPRRSSARTLAAAVTRLLPTNGRGQRPGRGGVVTDAPPPAGRADGPIDRAVAGSPLFRLLTSEQATEVVDVAEERTFSRGAILLSQGVTTKRLVVLVDGQAKTSHITADGREVVLSVLGPGDPIGVGCLLSDMPTQASVVTLESVRALIFHAEVLRRLRRTSPAIIAALAHTAGVLLQACTAQAIEWVATDIGDRVARRVVQLAERFGKAVDGTVEVPLMLTQEGLAAWAGISREAIVRQLADLRDDGLIRTGRCRIVVLDLERLRDRAGGPTWNSALVAGP